ncbi:Arf-GAP with SH3 domain, ANK repeat and PH domain-containing protein 2 [Trichoplax sp. H2]|nr:Arf-GAP with SH3 domain, ANK repeat and PH domain-containing protein 2 [Trichoplax sp. H2]|eukprot:RDD38364.1 Arf-GAP with SH3 domain, ANK repeat and PH domain-containing protein 2 [Trichoplax sp. H2]
MVDRAIIHKFIDDVRRDLDKTTVSDFDFDSKLPGYRYVVGGIEESLELDQINLQKLKKYCKSLVSNITDYSAGQLQLADYLDKLGSQTISKEAEMGAAFINFAKLQKELAALSKRLVHSHSNLASLQNDGHAKSGGKNSKLVRTELKKAVEAIEKLIKDYDSKRNERRKLDSDRQHESAESDSDSKRHLQVQLCDYFIKVNDAKLKQRIEFVQRLVDYYHSQVSYFQEGFAMLEGFKPYIQELTKELATVKGKQDEIRSHLTGLNATLKQSKTCLEQSNTNVSGYSLHGYRGDKTFGYEKSGYLYKKSEKGIRKTWHKRYCAIKNGYMTISTAATSPPKTTLNLLTCQAKDCRDQDAKKWNFMIFSSSGTITFQAEDESELNQWISVVANSREQALNQAFDKTYNSETIIDKRSSNAVKELTDSILFDIKLRKGNNLCCDCNSKDPTWLSTNLGILLCIECSGIHRQLGVQYSRIRSLTLDNIVTSELLLARTIGNYSFNEVFEASLSPEDKLQSPSQMDERQKFIEAKYIAKRFILRKYTSEEYLIKGTESAIEMSNIEGLLQTFVEDANFTGPLPNYSDGRNALHHAINRDCSLSLHIIDFLAKNSKDISYQMMNGDTALHIAARSDQSECIKLLAKGGINPNITNNKKETALDLAKSRSCNKCVDLLESIMNNQLSSCDQIHVEDWGIMAGEESIYVHIPAQEDFSDDELDDARYLETKQKSECIAPKDISLDLSYRYRSGSHRSDHSGRVDHRRSLSFDESLDKKHTTVNRYANSIVDNNKRSSYYDGILSDSSRMSNIRSHSNPYHNSANRQSLYFMKPADDNIYENETSSNTLPNLASQSGEKYSNPSDLLPGTLARKGRQIRVKALYDCEADNEDELSFQENEIIIVTSDSDPDWWCGYIEDDCTRIGMFPVVFVEKLQSI